MREELAAGLTAAQGYGAPLRLGAPGVREFCALDPIRCTLYGGSGGSHRGGGVDGDGRGAKSGARSAPTFCQGARVGQG